jgi:hypothetical protein
MYPTGNGLFTAGFYLNLSLCPFRKKTTKYFPWNMVLQNTYFLKTQPYALSSHFHPTCNCANLVLWLSSLCFSVCHPQNTAGAWFNLSTFPWFPLPSGWRDLIAPLTEIMLAKMLTNICILWLTLAWIA